VRSTSGWAKVGTDAEVARPESASSLIATNRDITPAPEVPTLRRAAAARNGAPGINGQLRQYGASDAAAENCARKGAGLKPTVAHSRLRAYHILAMGAGDA
jgi:hypothetical protein